LVKGSDVLQLYVCYIAEFAKAALQVFAASMLRESPNVNFVWLAVKHVNKGFKRQRQSKLE